MAICMAIQTLMFIAAAIGGLMAWRKTTAAVEEAKLVVNAQLVELRAHLAHLSDTVDQTAGAVRRGTEAVDGVMTDISDAMGTVRHSVGSVASAVASPKSALAWGVLQGIQALRRRRTNRLEEAASEL
jgi:t-SNARE complex subunit (syntaxin)